MHVEWRDQVCCLTIYGGDNLCETWSMKKTVNAPRNQNSIHPAKPKMKHRSYKRNDDRHEKKRKIERRPSAKKVNRSFKTASPPRRAPIKRATFFCGHCFTLLSFHLSRHSHSHSHSPTSLTIVNTFAIH